MEAGSSPALENTWVNAPTGTHTHKHALTLVRCTYFIQSAGWRLECCSCFSGGGRLLDTSGLSETQGWGTARPAGQNVPLARGGLSLQTSSGPRQVSTRTAQLKQLMQIMPLKQLMQLLHECNSCNSCNATHATHANNATHGSPHLHTTHSNSEHNAKSAIPGRHRCKPKVIHWGGGSRALTNLSPLFFI